MEDKTERVIQYLQLTDGQGHTVIYPFTKAERVAMDVGLKNTKGLVLAESLEEVDQCPIEPEMPFAISECGLLLETDKGKKEARQTAREQWLEGEEEEALKLLRETLDEMR